MARGSGQGRPDPRKISTTITGTVSVVLMYDLWKRLSTFLLAQATNNFQVFRKKKIMEISPSHKLLMMKPKKQQEFVPAELKTT